METKISRLNLTDNIFKPLAESQFAEKHEDFKKLFKKSFFEVGQIVPVVLAKEDENTFLIIKGANRIKALKAQKTETVCAFVFEDLEKEIAQKMRIDGKIIKSRMTVFEEAELFAKRKEIYNKEKRKDFADNAESIDISCFTAEGAKLGACSQRRIQILLQIHYNIFESVKKLIIENCDELKYQISKLVEIARIQDEETQKSVVETFINRISETKISEEIDKPKEENSENTRSESVRGEQFKINFKSNRIYFDNSWKPIPPKYKEKFEKLYNEAVEFLKENAEA